MSRNEPGQGPQSIPMSAVYRQLDDLVSPEAREREPAEAVARMMAQWAQQGLISPDTGEVPPAMSRDHSGIPAVGITTIRFEEQTWALPPGASVTFGRSRDADIVIPQGSEDFRVSRQAGRLTSVDEGLLITNLSTSNSIYLQGLPGPEVEIMPLMTVGTMPFTRCRLSILGSHDRRFVLDITCKAGTALAAAARPDPWRLNLPDRQRRYLAALCEPILTGTRATTPPTYREIAERCGESVPTVRNSLDELRQTLSDEYGIPGLVQTDAGTGKGPVIMNPLSVLAAWALQSGTVSHQDLEALDR